MLNDSLPFTESKTWIGVYERALSTRYLHLCFFLKTALCRGNSAIKSQKNPHKTKEVPRQKDSVGLKSRIGGVLYIYVFDDTGHR
jgi:hypothetical protein